MLTLSEQAARKQQYPPSRKTLPTPQSPKVGFTLQDGQSCCPSNIYLLSRCTRAPLPQSPLIKYREVSGNTVWVVCCGAGFSASTRRSQRPTGFVLLHFEDWPAGVQRSNRGKPSNQSQNLIAATQLSPSRSTHANPHPILPA